MNMVTNNISLNKNGLNAGRFGARVVDSLRAAIRRPSGTPDGYETQASREARITGQQRCAESVAQLQSARFFR